VLCALLVSLVTTTAPVKVAAMGLKPVNVDATEATFFNDYLAQQLRQPGELEVATQSELGAILGLERQKQLLGCSDAATGNCLAELSGALGVDAVIAGSIAKLGGSYVLTVSLVRVLDGKTVASLSEKFKTTDQVLDWLKAKAPELRAAAMTLRVKDEPAAAATAVSSGPGFSPHRVLPFVLIGVGAAAAVVGVVLQYVARATASNISNRVGGVTAENVDAMISTGKAYEQSSVVLMSAGLAVVAGGVVWLLLRPTDSTRVSFAVMPGGAFASFGGSLP
jgi:hypothetical protein